MPRAGHTPGWECMTSGAEGPVSAMGRGWAEVSEPSVQSQTELRAWGHAFCFPEHLELTDACEALLQQQEVTQSCPSAKI